MSRSAWKACGKPRLFAGPQGATRQAFDSAILFSGRPDSDLPCIVTDSISLTTHAMRKWEAMPKGKKTLPKQVHRLVKDTTPEEVVRRGECADFCVNGHGVDSGSGRRPWLRRRMQPSRR